MKQQLILELKSDIEHILSLYPLTTAYKIGKTSDEERRVNEYLKEGFTYLFPIAMGHSKIISEAEIEMIKIFKTDSKCVNEQIGGGNSDANILYLAIKCTIKSIDDLYDDEIYEPKTL